MNTVGTGTRLFAVLGDPVDHSMSPALHNAAFEEAGLDAVYVAMRVTEEKLVARVMRALAATGGGGNVTVPHKRAAAQALDDSSEAVRATGACNLFWWDEGRGLCGDNSDASAFSRAAEAVLDSTLEGRRVLVLGAGGAARAVVYACLQAEAARVELLNRTHEHAQALATELGEAQHVRVLPGPDALSREPYDLVVNATTLGLAASDALPLDLDAVRTHAVLDLVYSAEGTPWVQAARRLGLPAEDGRRMLVLQAAASFSRWFSQDAPLDAMARAVGLNKIT